MAITIRTPTGNVVAQEIVAGYSEHVDLQSGPSARKGFLVPWASRFQVAIGFLGLSNSTSIGGLITLQTPLPHPELTHAYAHSIDIQGVGAPIQGGTQLAYDKCIVWVNYKMLPWSFSPNSQINPNQPVVFAEQKISTSADYMTIPGYGLFWKTTTKTVQNQCMRYVMAIIDIEISLKNFPYMPSPLALVSSGCINYQTFFGVAPGSLMFMGVTTHQGADASGNLIQSQVDYKFRARSIVWNGAYNPATQLFDIISTASTYVPPSLGPPFNPGSSIIPYADFSTIIPAPYTQPSEWTG